MNFEQAKEAVAKGEGMFSNVVENVRKENGDIHVDVTTVFKPNDSDTPVKIED